MLLDKLRARVKSGLLASDEVKENSLKRALSEAKDIVGDGKLKDVYLLDIAYFRLLLLLKCEVSELDLKLYEKAKDAIDTTPFYMSKKRKAML